MTETAIIIRKIRTDEEARGKAYVHWRGWMDTYRGLIPYTYLETFTLEKCEKMALEFKDNTLIALDGDKVVGFAGYGSGRGDYLPPDGEIVGLYVLKEYQEKGIGYRLMQ
ncbi:MAG: GNAT family N-acetyltransferase, partial [Erysipelotrichaceae bacterium]|nr:GNAT family N-acetyltransferase [Erysipelotrichaceae bacterium]